MSTLVKTTFYPPIKRSTSINQFSVTIAELKLKVYVKVNVLLYSTEDNLTETKIYTLEGVEYQAWGQDDDYIINWVKAKLQNEGNN